MEQREFARNVAEHANLSREEAADLVRATLETLVGRLSIGEARHFVSYLPESLRDSVLPRDRPDLFRLRDFLNRVSARTGLNAAESERGIRAVMTTLREVVGDEVFAHVVSQLPAEFRRVTEVTV